MKAPLLRKWNSPGPVFVSVASVTPAARLIGCVMEGGKAITELSIVPPLAVSWMGADHVGLPSVPPSSVSTPGRMREATCDSLAPGSTSTPKSRLLTCSGPASVMLPSSTVMPIETTSVGTLIVEVPVALPPAEKTTALPLTKGTVGRIPPGSAVQFTPSHEPSAVVPSVAPGLAPLTSQ